MSKKFSRIKKLIAGYTLIEVLIAISIFAFVAMGIIYYINNSREKARMAGALYFSSSLKNSLAANLVAYWPLNEVNGGVTPDVWGKYNGTLVNGSTLVNGIIGKALQFAGNNFVEYPGGIDIAGNKITLAAWINHDGTGSYYKNIVARGNVDYGIGLNRDDKKAFFEINTETGGRWLAFGKPLKANTWYHVVGVYDGSKISKI